MKKFILAAMAAILSLSVCSCSREPAGEVLAFNEKVYTSSEIVERINNIGEVSLEKESEIESIYIDYTALTEKEKSSVSNYEALAEARDAIAELYNTKEKVGDRFDRSEILIGTYCFSYTGEESVKWLAEAGFDYATAVGADEEMLNYFEQYGIGAFISAGSLGIPSWRGGEREVGAHIEPSFTIETFREAVENATFDHPAMWGIELVDEPNSDDMPFIGEEVAVYNELNPDKLVYINLFPNGAQEKALGTPSYLEHVWDYAESVNTDYISLDVYPIYKAMAPTRGEDYFILAYLATMNDISTVCRETGRDVWAVLQAGSSNNGNIEYITLDNFRSQAYTALCFGAKAINWACWTNGWFDTDGNIIDTKGNKTPAYDAVTAINAELDAISPVYMKYTNTDSGFVAEPEYDILKYESWLRPRFDPVLEHAFELDQDMFENITVSNEGDWIYAGSFVKNDGNGEAIMFANATDFMYETECSPSKISFTLADENSEVVTYYPDIAYRLTPDENGVYSFYIANAEGVFVTVEHPEVVEAAE